MSVTMRIVQYYDRRKEGIFFKLEKKFAKLEAGRKDYPKGRRMKSISGIEPTNTFIWEGEFNSIEEGYQALSFFDRDKEHENLFNKQSPLIEKVRIEFYKNI